MSWAAVIGGGTAVLGGLFGSSGAKDAARAEERANQAAIDEQRRQFDLTRQDTAPYRQTGENALNRLAQLQGFQPYSRTTYGDQTAPANGVDPSSGMTIGPNGQVSQGIMPGDQLGQPDFSSFFMDPSYQFTRGEALQGVERSAAARGGLVSGNTGIALQERAGDIASRGYGDYYNRLSALAGIGQTGVNTATQAGQNSANNISQSLTNAGDARASGIAGSANAWGNALGQIGGIVYDKWGRKMPKPVGGTAGGTYPTWGS